MHVKIALLQTDPTVGDLEGNADLLAEAAGEAARAGAELAVAQLLGEPGADLPAAGHEGAAEEEVARRIAEQAELRGDGQLGAGPRGLAGRLGEQVRVPFEVADRGIRLQ
ncbi:MAG TPA: hypothetical protein VFD50_04010, partial [Thermoleophilia bacterium]|nr:hypothetical protein [Thermoleophilia bacterium]